MLDNSLRSFAIAALLCLASGAALADADGPCAPQLLGALKIAGLAPKVCETSTRLVPGRAVVLALWDTDPDSPPAIPFAAVLDRKALDAGRKDFLYKRPSVAEAITPFLFNGKTVNVAIADFDGSGRIGWAMMVVPDADYSFAVTAYDPRTQKFVDITPRNAPAFTANDLDAQVEVTPGQILIPICVSAGSTSDLAFDVYRLKSGHYEHGARIPATSAPAAERAKCKQSGP